MAFLAQISWIRLASVSLPMPELEGCAKQYYVEKILKGEFRQVARVWASIDHRVFRTREAAMRWARRHKKPGYKYRIRRVQEDRVHCKAPNLVRKLSPSAPKKKRKA